MRIERGSFRRDRELGALHLAARDGGEQLAATVEAELAERTRECGAGALAGVVEP